MTRDELNALPIGTKVRVKQYDELTKILVNYGSNGIYLPCRDTSTLLFNDRMKFFCGKEGKIEEKPTDDEVRLSFDFATPRENQHWSGGWHFCASMLEPVSPPPRNLR